MEKVNERARAVDEFFALLEKTETMQQVMNNLKEEPAQALGDICLEYQRTGKPVPDHRLLLTGYLGEAALRAFVSAGLIERLPGGTTSAYCYMPTAEGLKECEKMKAAGVYKRTW